MQSFGVEFERSLKYIISFGSKPRATQMCVGVMSAFDLEEREIAV